MEESTPGMDPGSSGQKAETDQASSTSEAALKSTRDKVCMSCFTVNPPDSLYCSKCGLKLPDVSASQQRVCPGCNTLNEATSQYCYKCGLKLSDQPEASLKYAGFWIRLVAAFIDILILSIIGFLVTLIMVKIASDSNPDFIEEIISPGRRGYYVNLNEHPLFVCLFLSARLIIEACYYTISVGKWGKTIGKMAIGAQVLRTDGSRVGYGRALARYGGYILNGFTLFIGFLIIAGTGQKQGLHDFICDTTVFKKN